ncbi:MAG: hypothetical protein ACRCZR_01075, partial [Cetobacterium sp.]
MDKNTSEKIFNDIKILLNLDDFKFDIFSIKKLAKTNTLGEKNGNQTHIAITGDQVDIFPYLYNYSYLEEGNIDFKKRFLLRIPIYLSENNLKYLNNENYTQKDNLVKTVTHFNHSKREDGSIQGELSYLKKEDTIFLDSFRRKLKENDYLIILKEKENYNYLFLGVQNSDMIQILNKYIPVIKTNYSDVFYDKVNPGSNLNVTGIDLIQLREFDELLLNLDHSDKLNLIGLYMAKFDKNLFVHFNCKDWLSLYKYFSDKMKENANGLKNRRDIYDPYFDTNKRVGHKRELTTNQKKILETFENLNESIFTDLINYIIRQQSIKFSYQRII